MTKALVCVMNSRNESYIRQLYGDPDEYAYKLNIIHTGYIVFKSSGYHFLHYLSIDYYSQKVYFTNNFNGRLEYGYFIYNNDSYTNYFDYVPDTKQVTVHEENV